MLQNSPKGRINFIGRLLICGADPKLAHNHLKAYPDSLRGYLMPALEYHLQHNNMEEFASLVSIAVDIAEPGEEVETFEYILALAAKTKDTGLVRQILAAQPEALKSRLPKPTRHLDSALRSAAYNGNALMLESLLDYHPLVRPSRKDGSVFSRLMNFFDDNLSFSGRVINKQGRQGETLLHRAAQSGNGATMTLLLERGADVTKVFARVKGELRIQMGTSDHGLDELPAVSIDYLLMKLREVELETSHEPQVAQELLSKFSKDLTTVAAELNGHFCKPTDAQVTMVNAGFLAQSATPEYLFGSAPYSASGFQDDTIDELNRSLEKWSSKRVRGGEALEEPFRDLVGDLLARCSRHASITRDASALHAYLLEQGMYRLLADCVVAAFNKVSHAPGWSEREEDDKEGVFAGELRQAVWFDGEQLAKRHEVGRYSANAVLFDALMRRQLDGIDQYCAHHSPQPGADALLSNT